MLSFNMRRRRRSSSGETEEKPSQATIRYKVKIPADKNPGEEFHVYVEGRMLRVVCPPTCHANEYVHISIPKEPPPTAECDWVLKNSDDHHHPTTYTTNSPTSSAEFRQAPPPPVTKPPPQPQVATFEVSVPPGTGPNESFAVMAGGTRILVRCPPDGRPGSRLRIEVPLGDQNSRKKGTAAKIELKYNLNDGWTRLFQPQDYKFHWARIDDEGHVENKTTRFEMETSAFVREIVYQRGHSRLGMGLRNGTVSLVPASQAVSDAGIKRKDGGQYLSYTDLVRVQQQSFKEKEDWFHDICKELSVDWSQGHIQITVRREHVFVDSVYAVLGLSRKELRSTWRFGYLGEAGIDAGGLARDWFQIVTENIFNPDVGLWKPSAANQMCMEINPASEFLCEDHLDYYRFLGRVLGKALFDQRLVAGHMVQYIYKYLLGWPINFSELEMVDEEYYNSLKQLQSMADNGDDISMLYATFSATEEDFLGGKNEIELVPGGADIEVTNDNFPEYLEACLKYRLLDRVKPQLTELLLGFFDVIPEPILTIFDFQELELLLCGLPKIDVNDWRINTEYQNLEPEDPVCQWFWEVVREYDEEMKARLLRFATASPGVPPQGFESLQGNDGAVRKFTIQGVYRSPLALPQTHTCFNRIDLPLYPTKAILKDKLTEAVILSPYMGFGME